MFSNNCLIANILNLPIGIVAIIRAILFVVNKEIWKTSLDFRLMVLKRDAIKEREITADSELNLIDQSVGLICEEFTKICEHISKIFHVGLSKHVFTTQTTHISTFIMGNTTNKIPNIDTTTLRIKKLYIVAPNLKCTHSNVKNNVKHQRQGPMWKTPVILPLPISTGKGKRLNYEI